MKFVITENKRERLIDNFLSEEYGGLKRGTEKNHSDLIFFFKDVEVPTARDLVFHYNKDRQSAVIPWEMVDGIRMFTSSEWESELFVAHWLNDTYGLNVMKLYKKF
jgi:hypothetical protein